MPGDNTILIAAGLDLKASDRISLAPTAMKHNESDYAVVTAYNNVTGVVTLDRKLNGYHYGAAQSLLINTVELI